MKPLMVLNLQTLEACMLRAQKQFFFATYVQSMEKEVQAALELASCGTLYSDTRTHAQLSHIGRASSH
jgi:hypothetical protein